MAEYVPPKVVDLTLENVVRAVEGVRKWKGTNIYGDPGLGFFLYIPRSKLDEIAELYFAIEERLRAVVEYWWAVDPSPSWRRIISALDEAKEHQIADQVRHNAEPLTDSTLSFISVIKVVEGVNVVDLRIYLGVLGCKAHHSLSDDQNREVAMRYWLQYGHNPSWANLAAVLYYLEEWIALNKVKKYIQQPAVDPTLTHTNLCTALEKWDAMRDDCFLFQKAVIKIIRYDYYSKPLQRQPELFRRWLSTHPARSWSILAEALYRCGEHKILKNVMETYINATDVTLYKLCLRYIENHYEYFSRLLHHLPSPVQRQIMKSQMVHGTLNVENIAQLRKEHFVDLPFSSEDL